MRALHINFGGTGQARVVLSNMSLRLSCPLLISSRATMSRTT
ncbi:unnamed protein product [Cylicostephanus goldi]|uniref:Uncharacterized protein n=1 Tax=Cylicostephanus goldi TaxID=71465 RepID=A0A3P7PM14_CYLGO|nr:unnamed protein product [Cylicostephanus goldi]